MNKVVIIYHDNGTASFVNGKLFNMDWLLKFIPNFDIVETVLDADHCEQLYRESKIKHSFDNLDFITTQLLCKNFLL